MMALHEQAVGATDEWYTPPYIFDAMDMAFDMDVASPGAVVVHWIPAGEHLLRRSLEVPWRGFVWMNPPFGARNGIVPWLHKFLNHADGVALVPDRTSAPWWQTYVPHADLVLFVAPKIKFVDADGNPGNAPAQGTCLLAKGNRGIRALRNAQKARLGVLMKTVWGKNG